MLFNGKLRVFVVKKISLPDSSGIIVKKESRSFSALVLWCSVVLRFNFSVLSEEIATRTKGKKAGEGLNHRGHRGHRERQFNFPLCPLCPLWLDFSDLCLRLGSGAAGRGSNGRGFRLIAESRSHTLAQPLATALNSGR